MNMVRYQKDIATEESAETNRKNSARIRKEDDEYLHLCECVLRLRDEPVNEKRVINEGIGTVMIKR